VAEDILDFGTGGGDFFGNPPIPPPFNDMPFRAGGDGSSSTFFDASSTSAGASSSPHPHSSSSSVVALFPNHGKRSKTNSKTE
jgi:hypothetical protein